MKTRYYTDIDFVLHYYAETYYEEVIKKYKIDMDMNLVSEESIRKIEEMDNPLGRGGSFCGLDSVDIDECVFLADQSSKWVPTSFGKQLGNFLGDKARSGSEVFVITARKNNRQVAEKIITQALGISVPVFCCNTENKHLIMNTNGCDNAIYIEDHSIAAIGAATTLGSSGNVIVPSWPWNKKRITDANIDNIYLTDPENILDTIEYLSRK